MGINVIALFLPSPGGQGVAVLAAGARMIYVRFLRTGWLCAAVVCAMDTPVARGM